MFQDLFMTTIKNQSRLKTCTSYFKKKEKQIEYHSTEYVWNLVLFDIWKLSFWHLPVVPQHAGPVPSWPGASLT